MKVEEIKKIFQEKLIPFYEEDELNEIISLVFEAVKDYSKTDLTLKHKEEINESEQRHFRKILGELKENIPVQYILGYTWFHGMNFLVNENVLIPRPETEELVRWIVESQKSKVKSQKIKILDIGTGSGCIAIALKKKLSGAEVSAMDISEKAIEVAKKNSELNNVEIEFVKADIFQVSSFKFQVSNSFDIIVSNPPYILLSEKQAMHERVVANEPHLALFVGEKESLIFYEAIADFAKQNLKSNGELYFEISETKGKEVSVLLSVKGFKNVELRKDMFGNDRMVRATL